MRLTIDSHIMRLFLNHRSWWKSLREMRRKGVSARCGGIRWIIYLWKGPSPTHYAVVDQCYGKDLKYVAAHP